MTGEQTERPAKAAPKRTTTEGRVTMALVQDIRFSEAPRGGMLAGLREALARRKVYRDTLRELKSLSSRELADLGIHRSMITRVATEAAYGK